MPITGDLHDIDLFTLIQTLCQDGRDTKLTVVRGGQRAEIYISEGNIVHATLGELSGEEAVIGLLAWREGTFSAERSAAVPTQTVFANMLGLLLEGMRRRDELQAGRTPEGPVEASEAKELATSMTPIESRLWERRDVLAPPLRDLAASQESLDGVLLVSRDGLTLLSETTRGAFQSARIGALAAGLLGMSQRSAFQLKHKKVERMRITSEGGTILIVRVTPHLLLAGIVSQPGVDLHAVEQGMRRCSRQLAAGLLEHGAVL